MKLPRKIMLGATSVVILAGITIVTLATQAAQGIPPSITGTHYRLFETSNTVSPGSPLAATNGSAQLSTQGQSFRLRTGLTTRSNGVYYNVVQAGYAVSCVQVSGIPYCSGRGTNGELGNNTRDSTTSFVPVDTSTGLAGKTITDFSISPATNNTVNVCAIADGELYCWGSNSFSILGVGLTTAQLADSTQPMKAILDGPMTGETVAEIDNGSGHVCGVTVSGKAFCWGTNGSGRLGDGTTSSRTKPTLVNTSGVLAGKTVTTIAAGSGHSCALADGAVYCWGSNSSGALGIGTTDTFNNSMPVSPITTGVLNGKTLVDLAIALNTTCVIDSAGAGYCWGQNSATIGNNTSGGTENSPVAVDMTLVPSGGFSALYGEANNFCGIAAADGLPYCWGINTSGATGRGTTSSATTRPSPAVATGFLAGKTVKALTAGYYTYCGLTNLDEAFCWGYNALGNLGMGTATSSYTVATELPGTAFTPAQGVTVASNTINTRLEYAAKTAGSCSAQTTGFAAVTTSTPIAWSTNGSVVSGTAITATANDPVSGGVTTLQTYVSAAADLNNPNAIPAGNTGLWDFSLKDNSGLFNQTYCLRLAQSNGTPYTTYASYPEITTAQGVLSVGFVDAADAPVAAGSMTMPSATVATSCQTTSGTLGTSAQKIRVNNDTTTPGWGLSIAATNGATAHWQEATNPYSYDFNDSSGSPAGCNSGLDGDGLAGQLTVNPSAGGSSIMPKSGCSNTGVSKGTQQAFIQGSVNSITLASASSGAGVYCYWDVTGVNLSQSVPASQQAGSYTLDMTITVLAQ